MLQQAHVASAMNMSQAAGSKLEFRTDSYISSVRRYVEALGGKLELRAVFPDREVRLRGLDGNPATGPFYNQFRLRFIDDDERQIEVEKDTGQIVHIPMRRIYTQRWRFVE